MIMAQSALKGCEVCERGSGNNFCLDCKQFLCDDCRKCHTRLKVSQNHKFKADSVAIPEVKSRCKEHNDEFLFLCVQCNIPVCRRCVSGAHKGHDMSNIDDVIAELKISARKTIESKSKLNDDVIETLVTGLKSLESDEFKAVKEIREEGVKMRDLIDQKTERKIALCKEEVCREREKIKRMLLEARDIKKIQNELKRLLDELKENIEDVSVLKKLKAHMASIDRMASVTVPTLPSVAYASRSIKLDDITNLMGTYTIQPMEKEKEIQHGFLYRCDLCGNSTVYKNLLNNSSGTVCLEVLKYEKQLLDTQISNLKHQLTKEQFQALSHKSQLLQQKADEQQDTLKKGGLQGLNDYVKAIESDMTGYEEEARNLAKVGEMHKAQVMLTKKKHVEREVSAIRKKYPDV